MRIFSVFQVSTTQTARECLTKLRRIPLRLDRHLDRYRFDADMFVMLYNTCFFMYFAGEIVDFSNPGEPSLGRPALLEMFRV